MLVCMIETYIVCYAFYLEREVEGSVYRSFHVAFQNEEMSEVRPYMDVVLTSLCF